MKKYVYGVDFGKGESQQVEIVMEQNLNILQDMLLNAECLTYPIEHKQDLIEEIKYMIRAEKEGNPSNNSKPCFEDWVLTFYNNAIGTYIFNNRHYNKVAMLEIYCSIYNKN